MCLSYLIKYLHLFSIITLLTNCLAQPEKEY